MRALSHHWRVTRQDSVVAQALLEKATAIDPTYGQALGLLAASHTFCAHMGWADTAAVMPIAERAALAAIRADGEDAWAHHALGCVYLFARRFEDSLAEFELALRLNPNFSLAQGYHGLTLAYCGRWQEGAAAAEPPRSVCGGLLRHCRLRPVCRPRLRGGHWAGASGHSSAGGFRRRPSRAHRRSRHVRSGRHCRSGPARARPRATQCLARLDRRALADQQRGRARALCRRVPARAAALMWGVAQGRQVVVGPVQGGAGPQPPGRVRSAISGRTSAAKRSSCSPRRS